LRLYAASSEETLRACELLKDWASDGYITKEQYGRMQQETVSELRTTNIFLRLILFFFALVSVGAAAALVLTVFLPRTWDESSGIFFLIFAALCYAAAEIAASKFHLYRYGIEEAFALCSVGFLCAGMQMVLFSGVPYSPQPGPAQSIVPAAGAVFSLWIWHRFGLWYAFLFAMIFAIFLPDFWTSSHPAQHSILAAFYLAGLIGVAAVRSRHRFDYLEDHYSLAEALLWLGIYLAFNLKLSSLATPTQLWRAVSPPASQFPMPFYWATWVIIWCLPPIVLARGIRQKDRYVMAVGAVVAILTFVSNKPYLGWTRHTWDPMLLGIMLTGVALFLRRWLAHGPNGIRHGFTAARVSRKDKRWMNVGSPVMGLVSPQSLTPAPQPTTSDFRFGGGSTGGGGAGGDF
jgi:hypothetical protein